MSELLIKSLPSAVTNQDVIISNNLSSSNNISSSSSASSSLSINHAERWSPYNINEGTSLALSGPDYVIVAGDTRMSDGYTILSRNVSKIYSLTSKCVLSTAGMQAEASTLQKVLTIRIEQYRQRHGVDIGTTSIAQLLSNTLYYKRFFPYYTFNVLGGLDHQGKGAVFGYDAIGSFERMPYCVTGSASALITSILDNQVAFKTQKKNDRILTLEEAIDLVKDVFTCAGERDIYTGDSVDLAIISKDGIKIEKFELKRD